MLYYQVIKKTSKKKPLTQSTLLKWATTMALLCTTGNSSLLKNKVYELWSPNKQPQKSLVKGSALAT